jgi:PAS domain S-box-containing protein
MELPYQRYFEAMPCYVTVQDREFRLVAANQRFVEDFGQIEGRCCYQVYKRRSEPCERCPVDRTFRDGECHESEEDVKALDGRTVSVIVYTTPIRNDAGEVTAVMEMSTDITELARLQRQLRESQARYHLLFEEVPCFISVQDEDLRIVEANRRFRQEFGEHFGRHCFKVYKHRDEECVPCAVQQTFADGAVHQTEEIVTGLDGTPLNVLVYSAPIRDAGGRIVSVMEMSTDITPVRRLQSQLMSLGLLIGSISHSIKGLLTGLDGGMYLVDSGIQRGDQARVTRGWEMVRRNVDRIRSVVLDILYYAKDRELNREPIAAAAIVDEVCQAMEARAREHGVTIERRVEEGAGIFEVDTKAIQALLVNLLENSIDACRVDHKKTEHKVRVNAGGDAGEVRLDVADNGIGMDRETREKTFTLFFSSKGTEGTGLGLFISQKIAHAHGGTIGIESEPGRGTTFHVRIPRRLSASG